MALESNSFTYDTGSGASYITPEVWSREIETYAKANLVVAPLGKQFALPADFAGTYNVQFEAELTASLLDETTAITPSSTAYTQVQFVPFEYGTAVAITRRMRIRSIQDIMAEKTQAMGYALAKKKDYVAVTTLVSGAGNSVVANSVAVSAIASSDTMDTDDIADALKELRVDDYEGKYLIIHPKQENALLKLSDFIDASVYGGREAVLNGEIGKYLGMRVLVTTQIQRNSTTSTAYDALLLDDGAFGVCQKMGIRFDSDYKVLEREFVIAAVEEYDIEVLHANKICKLTAYGG